MAVDEAGRVRLVASVSLLHPEQQTVEEMLDGWRNQQLSRNLQFGTIDQRIRYVRRFIDHANEFPWHWTPAMVEEYLAETGCSRRERTDTMAQPGREGSRHALGAHRGSPRVVT